MISIVTTMHAPLFQAPSEWTRQTRADPERKILEFPESVAFRDSINNPESDIRVVKRIGSVSSEGEVYQISYRGEDSALKLLPISSDDDVAKNMKEIDTAILASQMVMDGRCSHFPLVYGHGRCDDVYFFADVWRHRGEQYACLKAMREKVGPGKAKQMTALFRQGVSADDLAKRFNVDMTECQPLKVPADDLSALADKSSLKLGLKPSLQVPTDYLISELAQEDLSSWATRPHSVEEWRDIIHQVLETIMFMGREMKISHHDLHWGNILIKTIDDHEIALIHDFGKAEHLTPENAKDDVIKFLSSWTAVDYVLPPEIRREFQENEQVIRETPLEELL